MLRLLPADYIADDFVQVSMLGEIFAQQQGCDRRCSSCPYTRVCRDLLQLRVYCLQQLEKGKYRHC